jgi:hypothetical protein
MAHRIKGKIASSKELRRIIERAKEDRYLQTDKSNK